MSLQEKIYMFNFQVVNEKQTKPPAYAVKLAYYRHVWYQNKSSDKTNFGMQSIFHDIIQSLVLYYVQGLDNIWIAQPMSLRVY